MPCIRPACLRVWWPLFPLILLAAPLPAPAQTNEAEAIALSAARGLITERATAWASTGPGGQTTLQACQTLRLSWQSKVSLAIAADLDRACGQALDQAERSFNIRALQPQMAQVRAERTALATQASNGQLAQPAESACADLARQSQAWQELAAKVPYDAKVQLSNCDAEVRAFNERYVRQQMGTILFAMRSRLAALTVPTAMAGHCEAWAASDLKSVPAGTKAALVSACDANLLPLVQAHGRILAITGTFVGKPRMGMPRPEAMTRCSNVLALQMAPETMPYIQRCADLLVQTYGITSAPAPTQQAAGAPAEAYIRHQSARLVVQFECKNVLGTTSFAVKNDATGEYIKVNNVTDWAVTPDGLELTLPVPFGTPLWVHASGGPAFGVKATYPAVIHLRNTDSTLGLGCVPALATHRSDRFITDPDGARTALQVLDVGYYRRTHTDLPRHWGDGNIYEHWLRNGMAEGRQSAADFDVRSYLGRYPDLRRAFGDDHASAIAHWLRHGRAEGRSAGTSGPFKEGAVVRHPSTGVIAVVDRNGQRRSLTSMAVLNDCRIDMRMVQNLQPAVFDAIPSGEPYANAAACMSGRGLVLQPHGTLVRAEPSRDGAIFLIDKSGARRHITSPTVFNSCNLNFGAVKNMPVAQVDAMPQGPDIQGPFQCMAVLQGSG